MICTNQYSCQRECLRDDFMGTTDPLPPYRFEFRYFCRACDKSYSSLMHPTLDGRAEATCPDCGNRAVRCA